MSWPRIAVVGAGPSGCFSVQHLLGALPDARIDVLERLDRPHGLVTFGVAPDHGHIKRVSRVFDRVLGDDRVRLRTGIDVGADIRREDLLQEYDYVVYAIGATEDRLPEFAAGIAEWCGSSAMVGWYNSHPLTTWKPTLAAVQSVVVIGAGNVALDIVRLLARPASDLRGLDIEPAVLSEFESSAVRDIHVLARSDLDRSKFSPVHLRELCELPRVTVEVDQRQLDGRTSPQAEVLRGAPDGDALAGRRVILHFNTRCIGLAPSSAGFRLDLRTRVEDEEEAWALDAHLTTSAIGYRTARLAHLPYDDERGCIANQDGLVISSDSAQHGREWVVGWARKGPSGLLGTAKQEAVEVMRQLVLHASPKGSGLASAAKSV